MADPAKGSLLQNAALVTAAASDLFNPITWVTGRAYSTAYVAEWQLAKNQGRAFDKTRAAASAKLGLRTLAKTPAAVGRDVQRLIDPWQSPWPWVAAGVGLLVVAAIVAPYVTPFLRRVRA